MAIAYDQNVNLHISTTAEGGGEVTDLADRIEALGREAGAAQPQFTELATALRQAGNTQGALDAFRQAKTEVQRLGTEMDAAARSVDRLDGELNAARAATQAAAQSQGEAAQRMAQAKARTDDLATSLLSARNELKFLRDRSREAGADTEIYAGQVAAAKVKVEEYKAALASSRAEFRAQKGDQAAYAQALAETKLAEQDLSKEYDRAVKGAGKVSAALQEEQVRLDAARAVLNAAGIETTKLAEAQTRLAASMAATKGAAADLAQRYQATGAAARSAAQALETDFAAVGVRSAATIRTEILNVNQALGHLAMSSRVSGDEFNRAYAAGQAKIATLTAELKAAENASQGIGAKFKVSMGEAAASIGPVVKGLAVMAAGAEFVRVNVAMEAMDRSLTQILGSSAKAREEIDWLRATTNRLGVETISAGRAYQGLIAATKGTRMEGQATRDLFEAIAGSMAMLGKTGPETERALQAVSQMASKGTVSMEEMRQQLGEALPGAFQATADATGVTVAELVQMISSGQVLAEDMLPRLTEGLRKMYGTGKEVEGMASSWARMKNSVQDTLTYIGESGAAKAVSVVLDQVAITVRGLTGAFDLLGKSIGITIAGLVNFDLRHPIDSLKTWGEALKDAGDQAQKSLDKANGKLDESAKASAKAADAAKASAGSQETSWLAVVNAYAKVSKATAEDANLAQKTAAARAEEGKAATELANALGSESDKREANITAAANNADALTNLARARRIEAEVAKSNAIALAESAKVEKNLSEEKRKAIQAATDKAAAGEQEAQQAEAAARSANVHSAALQTEREMLKDNSGRVNELKAAMDSAVTARDALRASEAAGVATKEQVAQADIKVAQTSALYRDALRDTREAIERKSQAEQSQYTVQGAGIRLAIEQQRTIQAVAKARGDDYTATQAGLEIKKLEIQLAGLTAKAKAAEADAELKAVEAKRKELEAAGPLTQAQEAELTARKASAEVKRVEGQIASETAGRMRELFDQTQANAQAAQSGAQGYDEMAGALRNVGEAADEANGKLNRVAQGSKGRAGQAPESGKLDLLTEAYKQGATVQEGRLMQGTLYELFNAKLASIGTILSTDDYYRKLKQITNESIKESLADARKQIAAGQGGDQPATFSELQARNLARMDMTTALSNGQALNKIRAANQAAGQEAQRNIQQRVYKVEIGSGQNRASLTANSDAEAQRFVDVLKTHMARAM